MTAGSNEYYMLELMCRDPTNIDSCGHPGKGVASNIFVENHDPSFTADRAGYHSIEQQHNASPFRPARAGLLEGEAAQSAVPRWRPASERDGKKSRRRGEIRDGGAQRARDGESGGRRARDSEMVATADCSGEERARRWRRRDGTDGETA
ncbi:hypothetical protein Syun_026242 [Stephania yunnanensis]|uniref:Uncharacterized protein n=1 Tax=Stephania yunnanensis TaxID=152371 RepID=A0AAP0EYJ4_9MAGN